MWIVWVMTAMLAVTGFVALGNQMRTPPVEAARASDSAWNLRVYRRAVIAYAAANTPSGAAVTVPDSRLDLPSWFVRNPDWSNKIDGGTIAVYAKRKLSAEYAQEVLRLSGGSVLAGVADAGRGVLISPIYGDTNIPIPNGIPDGALVWLAYADRDLSGS